MPTSINDFAYRTHKIALSMGYTESSPKTFDISGTVSDGSTVTRVTTVSTVAPTVWTDNQLWLKMPQFEFYKSRSGTWVLVTLLENLFEDSATGLPQSIGAGGALTEPLYLNRDPVEPTEAVTKQYVDTLVLQVSGSNLYLGTPVGTLAELRAIPTVTLVDRQIAYVEEMRIFYAYDLQGVGEDDGRDLIVPNTLVGRWYTTYPYVVNGGTF